MGRQAAERRRAGAVSGEPEGGRSAHPALRLLKGGKLEFHEVANVFPLMEGEEFRELVRDIEKNG